MPELPEVQTVVDFLKDKITGKTIQSVHSPNGYASVFENGSLMDYRVPRFSDLPKDIRLILAQNQDGVGPYGAKGGGEGALNPIPASLANALYRATGVRVREVPLTPERVWRALQEAKNKKS